MRAWKNYKIKDWATLSPIIDVLKEKRNDIIQNNYYQQEPNNFNAFLQQVKQYKNKNIISIVAFNVPDLIDWNLEVGKYYIKNVNFIVFDNSSDAKARKKIEQICKNREVPYLALPSNKVKHPSRSHGTALNWIYHKVIKVIEPNIFGFIDHDNFPIDFIDLNEMLLEQAFYGVLKESKWSWNLWAGFSFYRFEKVKDIALNFLNDRPNGLDTGGRNWGVLYKNYLKNNLKFPSYIKIKLKNHTGEIIFNVDNIDNKWIHFRGAYTTNLKSNSMEKKLNKGELLSISRAIYERNRL